MFSAFLGLSARFAGAPGATAEPLCVGPGLRNPDLPIVSLAQILLGAVALVGGFAFARGIYFRGIALALHRPFAEGPIDVDRMQDWELANRIVAGRLR